MSVARLGQVTDPDNIPVQGASVYVFNTDGSDASIYSDSGLTQPIAPPVITDQFGAYTYYANDNQYREDTYYGGHLRWREALILGDPPQFKGDPGANVMAIGLFTQASSLLIPSGTALVQTSGYSTAGKGHARYAYDAAVNSAYVAANPYTSFIETGGRGFRIVEQHVTPFHFGAVGDGVTDDTNALNAANTWYFNDGTTFHDVYFDLFGDFLFKGQFNLGPSVAPTTFRKWNFGGNLLIRQGQSGVINTVQPQNIRYNRSTLNISVLGYGITDTMSPTYAQRDSGIGINFVNCGGAGFGLCRAKGFWYFGTHIIGAAPAFAESQHLDIVEGFDNGSGYTGQSLTANWSSPSQTGTSGNTGQRQIIHVDTLPPVALDTLGPGGTLGECQVRINGTKYHIYSIDRVGSNLTIFNWLDPAAGTSGTLEYCYGGILGIFGGDGGMVHVGTLYGLVCGNGLVSSALYGPRIDIAEIEDCGTAIVEGISPDNVTGGTSIGAFYPEACTEQVVFKHRWGSSMTCKIDSTYPGCDLTKWFCIGDPRNTDGTIGFAGGAIGTSLNSGGGQASITVGGRRHQFYMPPLNIKTGQTSWTVLEHSQFPTIQVWKRDSLTFNLGVVGTQWNRLFGYDNVTHRIIGSGPNGAPTGSFPINPTTAQYTGTLTSGSAVVTMASTAGLIPNMPISGTGVPGSTTILSVNSATQITMSANATASGSQALTVTGSITIGSTVTFGTVTLSGFSGPVDLVFTHTDIQQLQWKVGILCGQMLSGGSAVGYVTGSGVGGAVAQATSKSTAVTLNKMTGAITLNSAALAAGAVVSFTLNNSQILPDDELTVRVKSGYATAGTYRAWAEGNGTGTRTICVQNISSGSLSEAVVLGFINFRGASS